MDESARIAAVRERLRPVQDAGALARRSAPSCHRCIYGPINDSGKGPCEHPVHYRVRYDPVLGKFRGGRDPVGTTQARGESGLCGPEGLLFEGYSWWRRPFRWLAQRPGYEAGMIVLWAGLALLMAIGAVIITILGRW